VHHKKITKFTFTLFLKCFCDVGNTDGTAFSLTLTQHSDVLSKSSSLKCSEQMTLLSLGSQLFLLTAIAHAFLFSLLFGNL
jgi:hypothetical protein